MARELCFAEQVRADRPGDQGDNGTKRRTARWFVALAVAAGALAFAGCQPPVTATATAAAPAPAPPVPSHLYSADAGFGRGSTIVVQATADPNVATAAAWWNEQAGRTVFTVGGGHVQVTVQNGAGPCADAPTVACAAAFPVSGSFASPPAYAYNSCAIYLKAAGPNDWRLYAHELGHCLGFDHVTERASIMNSAADASNPAADQSMLHVAGY
jgi:hypothetical protein